MCIRDRVGNRRGTRLVSTTDGTFGRRIKAFHRGKKTNIKTIPWKIVGRSGEPKWARERCCRREPGRLGAGELGLQRSSVAVTSRKAEGPLVVWVRSVGGGAKKLGQWSASAKKALRGAGAVSELVSSPGKRWKGRCSQRGLMIFRRYRQYESSARVSGSAQKARRECILKVRTWGGRYRG